MVELFSFYLYLKDFREYIPFIKDYYDSSEINPCLYIVTESEYEGRRLYLYIKFLFKENDDRRRELLF